MSAAFTRPCIAGGGLAGAIAVATGAFGAHGLKHLLEATGQAASWETASRYAAVHALALVACGLAAALPNAGAARRTLAAAGWCFGLGTAIFSGLLWTLALTGIRPLGAIVPVGGSLLIAGWALLGAGGLRIGAASPSTLDH
ncbi:MAG: DUF423 domain-containing protein [Planctomycetaceae bacterium]